MVTHLCNRCSEIRDYNIAEALCADCIEVVRREYEEDLRNQPSMMNSQDWVGYYAWTAVFGVFAGEPFTRGRIVLAVFSLPIAFLVSRLL